MITTKKDNTNKNLNKQPVIAIFDDIPQMDAISQDIWGEEGKYSLNFYSSVLSQNLSYVFKEKNGEVTAFCLARYEYKADRVGIYLFCVKKSYQGKGLGKALLSYCLDNCRKKGLKNFYLHTAVTNYPAINLYMKLGFRVTETILNYYCNDPKPHNDAFLMSIKEDDNRLGQNSIKLN